MNTERWIRGWLAAEPVNSSQGAESNMSDEIESLLELRLEVATIDPTTQQPMWELLDFAHDENDSRTMVEIKRVFDRFARIVVSLKRQAGGQRARNEPYRELLGVRCRLRDRVLGIWPSGPHDAALAIAPLAPASVNTVERAFEAWRSSALQKSRVLRRQSEPPPCRANRADSRARSDE